MTHEESTKQWAIQLAKLNDGALIQLWHALTESGTTPALLAGMAAEIMKRNIDLTNQ